MKIKKIISLLLATAICISMLALSAFAASSDSSDFTIENGVLIAYNGKGGDITIPNSVTSIGADAFNKCMSLTSITIPSSVTSIGHYAFDDCIGLSNISVDANNPNYLSENGVLFNKNKTKLIQYPVGSMQTVYNIAAGVTNIDEDAFVNSLNLTDITVDIKNPNYSSVNGILFNKNKTQLIQYPLGNKQKHYNIPNSVTSVGLFAFNGCLNLNSVNIPNSVISINALGFSNCMDLTSVTIPGSVTSIGTDAFYGCTNLTSTIIQSGDTVIGTQAFYGCNDKLTIYSCKDSYAQTYANDNNITFSSIYPSFDTVKYSTTSFTNKNVIVTISVNNATVSSVSHTFTANGSYTFTVTGKAGNKATKIAKVSNIDKTKPTIKVSIGNGKKTKGKVTVTVSDANLKAKSIKLNGKYLIWTNNNTFTSKGGYTVRATDKAGNTSSASFSIK